ncbi:Retrovirus-related Pol polyprotein, partial [Mucuna pruriens]
MAKYEACAMEISMALKFQAKIVKVYGDSTLVIHQLRGEWETRDVKLMPYHSYIKQLMEWFKKITFQHIPCEENKMADTLANLSSMFKINQGRDVPVIRIRRQVQPTYCQEIEEEADGKPWYYGIKGYIKDKEYPHGITKNNKRTLKILAMEAKEILEEIHEGAFRTHANRHAMARNVSRARYYWTKMEADCYDHVRKCHKCQIYSDNVHVANASKCLGNALALHNVIEATLYAIVTRNVVVKFIKRGLICQYGLPGHIITNNGTNLNNKMMEELCNQFKIRHCPKMNGVVQVANKNIKKIIQKMVVTYKDWQDMLSFSLHGYRTLSCSSTRATPYSLVYDMETILPIEVEISSLRVLVEAKLEEAKRVQNTLQSIKPHSRKEINRPLSWSTLSTTNEMSFRQEVLKKIIPVQKDYRGKWTPNYEGLYVVRKIFLGGAMILTNMDGEDLLHPVNSDAVKKFYP